MKEEFIKVCDFCREYPTEIHGGLPTNDPRVAEVKKSLSALASRLQVVCATFTPVPLKVASAKGAGAFPRIPYIVILPPGQKTNDGVYVAICFGKEGAGAVIGFAQSVDHPQPGFPRLIRDIFRVDVAQFNSAYANPMEIMNDDFSEEKLIAHLKESIALCLSYLGDTPLQKLVAVFRKEFPDFKTFDTSGVDYLKHEDSYKRKTVTSFREELAPWLGKDPESMTDGEFESNLQKMLQRTGLINHFLLTELKKKMFSLPELSASFKLLCHRLLSKAVKGEKLDSELDALIDFLRDRCKLTPGLTKQIPTFLLMFANPAEYIYIGPTDIEKFFSILGFADFDSNGKFAAEQYAKALSYLKKVKGDLAELKPRDLIDLQSFYFVVVKAKPGAEPGEEPEEKGKKVMLANELVDAFKQDVASVNIRLADSFLARFISALAAKPFVILTGLSGSGKSMLAQAFTHWLVPENKRRFVPVGADWTNNEHLLGYPNALETETQVKKEYVMPDTGVLELVLDASDNPKDPYFLVLDEMNLSHVERYFADFLSAMESKEKIHLYKGAQRAANGRAIPKEISWPKNLFIIGTVNIDETTYMFSPKVLDRAQVIEFRVDKMEMAAFLEMPPEPIDVENLNEKGSMFASAFMAQAKDGGKGCPREVTEKLGEFFNPLSEVGAEFGYRTAKEFLSFVGHYTEMLEVKDVDTVIDFAIIQKLLPKLHGSKRKLQKPLNALWTLCLKSDSQTKLMDSKGIKFTDVCKYPVSALKISRMYFNADENGFTSYAEA
jgi:5-methylcytosine-specific restriction protein B